MKERNFFVAALLGAVTILIALPAQAQLAGHNTKGDFGLQAGSQPPPGVYAIAPMYYRYDGDSLKNRDGNTVSIDPEERGSVVANAYVFGLIWVTDFKILGANYSFQIYPAFTDNTLAAPILGLDESVSTGFTDLYFQPVNLGWQTARADFVAGLESMHRQANTSWEARTTWASECGVSNFLQEQQSTSMKRKAGTWPPPPFTNSTPIRKIPTSG